MLNLFTQKFHQSVRVAIRVFPCETDPTANEQLPSPVSVIVHKLPNRSFRQRSIIVANGIGGSSFVVVVGITTAGPPPLPRPEPALRSIAPPVRPPDEIDRHVVHRVQALRASILQGAGEERERRIPTPTVVETCRHEAVGSPLRAEGGGITHQIPLGEFANESSVPTEGIPPEQPTDDAGQRAVRIANPDGVSRVEEEGQFRRRGYYDVRQCGLEGGGPRRRRRRRLKSHRRASTVGDDGPATDGESPRLAHRLVIRHQVRYLTAPIGNVEERQFRYRAADIVGGAARRGAPEQVRNEEDISVPPNVAAHAISQGCQQSIVVPFAYAHAYRMY